MEKTDNGKVHRNHTAVRSLFLKETVKQKLSSENNHYFYHLILKNKYNIIASCK